MNDDEINIKKDFFKFVEFIGKDNIIPIPTTPYHYKLYDWLCDTKIAIDNQLAIPQSLLGKGIPSRCRDDEMDTISAFLNLEREIEKVKIECVKERKKSNIFYDL